MHIVTIEDPIEFTFKDDKCIINQREVGIDVLNWDTALKHAVRQDPDIILVGEMRDRRHVQRRHARGRDRPPGVRDDPRLQRASTISRILDLFPQDMHSAMRQNLAFNLKAIVAEKTSADDEGLGGHRPARPASRWCEVMRINPTVRKLILNEEDIKLAQAIRMGKEEGMVNFTESLRQLVRRREDRARHGLRGRPQSRDLAHGAQGHYPRPNQGIL